ncbi:MAG: hypothetical protein ACKOEZ_05705 [Spartobacteria bacterium]
MIKPKKTQIRSSTAEFLVFTSQAGEKGSEVRPAASSIPKPRLSPARPRWSCSLETPRLSDT